MNTSKLRLIAIALLFTCLAQAQTNTYNTGTLSVGALIPDGNPVGTFTTVNVSGLSTSVANVSVNLNISGGFNGDLYVSLAGPASQFAVLLNRVGVGSGNALGYGDAGFNITLDQSGPNIHSYQLTLNPGGSALTGTWAADGRNIDPQSTPVTFDSASTAANLSVFNNVNPNGTWTLFLADLSGGGQSTLVSWGLTIVTVPEPQTWAMLAGGMGMLFMLRRRTTR